MDRLFIAAAAVIVLVCGATTIVFRLARHADKEELVHDYLAKLKDYVESRGEDGEAYGWLTHRSNKMQNQLGSGGMATYKPPFANYQYSNFPVILNMLPQLRHAFEDNVLSRNLAHQYAATIQEVLVRHAGTLEDRRTHLVKELKNPIVWLREGIRMILAFPFSLLSWSGLISGRAIHRITGSLLFTAASGLITLLGLFSAVIGIVLGWEPFVQLVSEWWGSIRS